MALQLALPLINALKPNTSPDLGAQLVLLKDHRLEPSNFCPVVNVPVLL